MNKKIEFNTASGPAKICTLWEFMNDVRKEQLSPGAASQFRISRMEELNKRYSPLYPTLDGDLGSTISMSEHILKQNPMSILNELKRTTTNLERRGTHIKFSNLLEDLVHTSAIDFGAITHIFSVGQHRYAFVNSEDVVLFIKDNYSQSLVCTKKNRNFVVYAPNLKLKE